MNRQKKKWLKYLCAIHSYRRVEGKVLTITPVDYNSCIPAGGSVSDIGFILQISQK